MNRPLRRVALVLLLPLVRPPAGGPGSRLSSAGAGGAPGRGGSGWRLRLQRAKQRRPEQHPALLLAGLAALTALTLAALLQSLLAPRWPAAALPPDFGEGLRLGDRPLRLLGTLPGQRDRDQALSETLIFDAGEPGSAAVGGTGNGAKGAPNPSLGSLSGPANSAGRGARRVDQPRSAAQQPGLELRLLAAQTRHRSDLAGPRLTRNRPDLRLTQLRLIQATPEFGYAKGLWNGQPALQTCLTGQRQGGYSEQQLSHLRDRPPQPGWPWVLTVLGLRDNRDFSCVLVTVVAVPRR